MKCLLAAAVSFLLLYSCNTGKQKTTYSPPENSLFTLLPSSETGIKFTNVVVDDKEMNIFNYRNFYNGAGVAIGDINNDGLPDIFFTSNKEENKLYLNKGNFKFEDITHISGVNKTKYWSTGVTMADINADGLLDIYVCNAGDVKGHQRVNQLFINNGNKTFTEKANEYHLQDEGGYHTHASFFDFDADGDLDCYLLNNSSFPVARITNWNQRLIRDSTGGDKLLRNDAGIFTDVSEQAGIYGSLIGFGLGVTVGDVNNDMWPDMYISNDFFEKDYLYINQHNGTFKESIDSQMQHTSQSSMGADMADINNDGWPDIFSTDMLPEDDYRLKTMTRFEEFDFFNAKLKGNLHRQFLQNCLQLNNGDQTFSEISQMAGVNATDWSWGALIFDFNNDGFKDIFVCNGMNKDITNQDYIDFLADEKIRNEVIKSEEFDISKFISKMKSTALPNYAFVNNKTSLTFTNDAYKLGLAKPSLSNGAAYSDLDNDGDLDLVVNNVNMESFIYRNNSESQVKNKYLKIKLLGTSPNTYGIGAKVIVYAGADQFMVEQHLSRGFQSSIDPVMCIGLGTNTKIDSVTITWPNFKKQVLENVAVNNTIIVKQSEANLSFTPPHQANNSFFKNKTNEFVTGDLLHKEDAFIDFNKEQLLPKMLSTEGPKIAVADVNGDGFEDFIVGGAAGDVTKLFLQNANGHFNYSSQLAFEQDKELEDTGIELSDIDGDNDLDLIIASGGNDAIAGSTRLVPRIYFNDGKGRFEKTIHNMPYVSVNASCIRMHDCNGDGLPDMFVGGRNIPGQYGVAAPSFLLLNNGKGIFEDVTDKQAPQLKQAGMITDAQWADIDGDGKKELITVGDWMPISVYKYAAGKLQQQYQLPNSNGWWNCLLTEDINNDGLPDIIAGNWGYNSKLKASVSQPASLYVNDFDQNGSTECIPVYYKNDGIAYPYFLRNDISQQLPFLKKKFLRYDVYAGKTMEQIFSPEQLKTARVIKVNHSETSVFVNKGNNTFTAVKLPEQAQITSVYNCMVMDVNKDGFKDIILTGNLFGLKPEMGRMDASYSVTLAGSKNGSFTYLTPSVTGLLVKGEVRDVKQIHLAKKQTGLIVARSNDALQLYQQQ